MPHFLPVTVVQVIDLSFCDGSFSNPSLASHLLLGIISLRIALSVMLVILAVIPTLKELVVMYKVSKKWQPNHYMQLFVKDGILYFIAYVSHFPILSVPFVLLHTLLSSTCKKTNQSDPLGIWYTMQLRLGSKPTLP